MWIENLGARRVHKPPPNIQLRPKNDDTYIRESCPSSGGTTEQRHTKICRCSLIVVANEQPSLTMPRRTTPLTAEEMQELERVLERSLERERQDDSDERAALEDLVQRSSTMRDSERTMEREVEHGFQLFSNARSRRRHREEKGRKRKRRTTQFLEGSLAREEKDDSELRAAMERCQNPGAPARAIRHRSM